MEKAEKFHFEDRTNRPNRQAGPGQAGACAHWAELKSSLPVYRKAFREWRRIYGRRFVHTLHNAVAGSRFTGPATFLVGSAALAVALTLTTLYSPSYRVTLDGEPVGVVADASFLLEEVYAQIWYPYMYDVDERRERLADSNNPGLGAYRCYALVERGASVGDTRERIRERLDRFGRSLGDGMTFTSLGGPDRHWESLFRYWSNQAPDVAGELFRYGMVFFFLLLVPAVSLSGLADSRMERRLAEMGARRAFGAPRSALMGQVLTENLLYTLLGGALGLLFSFAVAYGAREWIFKIGKGFTAGPMAGVEQSFPLDGLLNPWVFLIALAVCFVLNLMSTLWPAWRAARRPIVESLNA